MIDHISLRVSDFKRSLTFYKAALEPMGYTLVFSNDQEQYAGFAGPDRERIWIGHTAGGSHGYGHIAVLAKDRATVAKFYEAAGHAAGCSHGYANIADSAKDRATVRKFYEAAMNAGGRDNGGEGLRPHYSPT